MQGTFPEP